MAAIPNAVGAKQPSSEDEGGLLHPQSTGPRWLCAAAHNTDVIPQMETNADALKSRPTHCAGGAEMVGGSCPNVACLPGKNIIQSATVASLARRGTEFGLELGSMPTNMAGVQRRKQSMVDALIKVPHDRSKPAGSNW